MALFLRPVSEAFDGLVRDDLLELVTNDATLAFGAVAGEGQTITYTAPSSADEIDLLVVELVSSPATVSISGRDGDFLLPGGDRLREHAGNTGGSATLARIAYDVTLCDTNGYLARAADGTEIPVPRAAILVNELSEARSLITGAANAEVESRRIENVYRVRAGLPVREPNTTLSCGGSESSGSLFDCFIATAAFGSTLDDRVSALRSFRDEVLRQTRSGREFFDAFWPVYYQVSPSIVARMNADPRAREGIRIALVEPIVRFLDLFLALPAADLDKLPAPWAGFAVRCVESFGQWAAQLPLPTDFRDRSSGEALRELQLVLRHALTTKTARQDYLKYLADLGQWPPPLTSGDASALDSLLGELRLQPPVSGQPELNTGRNR